MQACRMMEDMAPAVLWFDEIEMGITLDRIRRRAGPHLRASSSPGCRRRRAGCSSPPPPTASTSLPAEMIRKGRFDEVFFVDLPLEDEQIEIFKIHLSRRGVDPSRVQPRRN